jgi:hypothetical protein
MAFGTGGNPIITAVRMTGCAGGTMVIDTTAFAAGVGMVEGGVPVAGVMTTCAIRAKHSSMDARLSMAGNTGSG